MLNRILKRIPSGLIYKFLNTPIGNYMYSRMFAHTRTRDIELGSIRFKMQTPFLSIALWDDYRKNGCHEPMTTRAFIDILSEVDDAIVWDIGSKCGYFMMVAAEETPPSNIHVFEPEPPHLKIIQENNERWLGGQAVINDTFVGDANSAVETTGDTYAAQHGSPYLVKIDVDGPEIDVLRGMKNIIEKNKPTFLIELHVNANSTEKVESLKELFGDEKYELSFVQNHRDLDASWRDISDVEKIFIDDEPTKDMLIRCLPENHNLSHV